MLKRFLVLVMTMIGLTAGTLVVASPAQAHNEWPYTDCNLMGAALTSYAYGSGANAVYAGGWRHYYDDALATGGSNCEDINVKINYNGYGAATVRIQFCPENYNPPHLVLGQPAPQFNCYSMGWGYIPTGGCECGTSVHDYHYPSTNWHWWYRVETLGSAEYVNVVV